jgi:hypothetical protein
MPTDDLAVLDNDDLYAAVEELTKAQPSEGWRLDYTEQWDDSALKNIAAFAHSFGGLLIVGVRKAKVDPAPKLVGVASTVEYKTRIASAIAANISPVPVYSIFECHMPGTPTQKVCVVRVAVVHARDIGPGIARNLHAVVWLLPAPFKRDNITANEIVQNLGFQNMLKSFQKERVAHGEGPSLAIGQIQDYVTVSPVLTEEQLKNWKNQTTFVLYIMGEVTWHDESGEWKTDTCKLLTMPRRVGNTPLGVGAFAGCDGHNGIAEPFVPLNP